MEMLIAPVIAGALAATGSATEAGIAKLSVWRASNQPCQKVIARWSQAGAEAQETADTRLGAARVVADEAIDQFRYGTGSECGERGMVVGGVVPGRSQGLYMGD